MTPSSWLKMSSAIWCRTTCRPKRQPLGPWSEIGSSLIAVVLVMASVFIPAAFLPGTTGQLYKQFAITIVISVALSGFVALTLTPAMCGLLLRHAGLKQTGFFGWFNRQVDRVTVWLRRSGAVIINTCEAGVCGACLSDGAAGAAVQGAARQALCPMRTRAMCSVSRVYAQRRKP